MRKPLQRRFFWISRPFWTFKPAPEHRCNMRIFSEKRLLHLFKCYKFQNFDISSWSMARHFPDRHRFPWCYQWMGTETVLAVCSLYGSPSVLKKTRGAPTNKNKGGSHKQTKPIRWLLDCLTPRLIILMVMGFTLRISAVHALCTL